MVLIPADALRVPGPVAVPELAALGAGIGRVSPEDVPGPWDQDFSHVPQAQRPVIKRPPMGLVLRVHSRAGLGVTLLDDAGDQIHQSCGTIGPLDDGSVLMYWLEDPALNKLSTVRVEVFEKDA